MRIIDRLLVEEMAQHPSANELRTADPGTLHAHRRLQYIELARFMADCGANSVSELKASQKREYDRRKRAIAQIEAATPRTHSIHEAQLRLLNTRSTHV